MLRSAILPAVPKSVLSALVLSVAARSFAAPVKEKARKKTRTQPVTRAAAAAVAVAEKNVIRQVPDTSTKLRLRIRRPAPGNPHAFVLAPARVDPNPWYFDDDTDTGAVGGSDVTAGKQPSKSTGEATQEESEEDLYTRPLLDLLPAALAGKPREQRHIGLRYLARLVVAQDDPLLTPAEAAARGGSAGAAKAGKLLESASVDEADAVGAEWLERAAELGDVEAHLYLAARAEDALLTDIVRAYEAAAAAGSGTSAAATVPAVTPVSLSAAAGQTAQAQAQTQHLSRAGVLGALDHVAALHAAAAALLTQAARASAPPPVSVSNSSTASGATTGGLHAPRVRSSSPLELCLWHHLRSVERSKSPHCFNQFVAWAVTMDYVCAPALEAEGEDVDEEGVAAVAPGPSGVRAGLSAEDDEDGVAAAAAAAADAAAAASVSSTGAAYGEAAVAAMAAIVNDLMTEPDRPTATASISPSTVDGDHGSSHTNDGSLPGAPLYVPPPAGGDRTVFLPFLSHYAQTLAAGRGIELLGDACFVLALVARAGGEEGEARRWEEVGARNDGKGVWERALERDQLQRGLGQ